MVIDVDALGHINRTHGHPAGDAALGHVAAVLAGFSRYAPVDGAAADNATDVLVWYSPTAMHFGIRASAPAGSPRSSARRPEPAEFPCYCGL